jgi:hypothetical protein
MVARNILFNVLNSRFPILREILMAILHELSVVLFVWL